MQTEEERNGKVLTLDGRARNGNGDGHGPDTGVLRLADPDLHVAVGTTVVIPALNEEETVGDVVRRAREVLDPDDEVIVVDDGSTDDTGRVAEEAGARVVRRPYPFGNGSAIKAGARAARGERIIMLDADGQHDPALIPRLLEELEDHDMVVAAREADSHASRGRRLANAVFNRLASKLTNREILDLTSGYRAVRRRVLHEFLPLLPNQFSYPTTITMACLRAGYTVSYVPIRAAMRRGKEKSKIKPVSDGLKFLTIIFKIVTLFAPMRVFAPVSALPFGIGALTFLGALATGGGASTTGALLLTMGLFLFCIGLVSEQIAALRFERHGNHGPV